MFKEINNRDAYSTLRGFVYQVDVTILRWMNLRDNEILELEKGEDIDIINKDILGNEIARQLEQIKCKESNISLNEESILEILLNFFIHKQNNPSQNIYFRYVTNAGYKLEKPKLFKDKTKGIQAWSELRELESIDINENRFKAIKTHLEKKTIKLSHDSKFSKDDKEKWLAFYNYITVEQNLINFIQDFEWSLDNKNYIEIGAEVKENLISLGLSIDLISSEYIYSRLFLFVFKLLCNNSTKELNRDILYKQISLPELNKSEEKSLEAINLILSTIKNKIDILEEKIDLGDPSKIQPLLQSILIENNSRKHSLDFKQPTLLLVGRESEKEALLSFAHNPSKFKWWSVIGKGGVGKSKLAWEVSKILKNEGIYSGFILNSQLKEFNWAVWQPLSNTFLVIDAHISEYSLIKSLIETLTSRTDLKFSVKLLVIDRDYLKDEIGRLVEESYFVSGSQYTLPFELKGLSENSLYDIICRVHTIQGIAIPDFNKTINLLRRVDGERLPLYALLVAEAMISNSDDIWDWNRNELFKSFFYKENLRWRNELNGKDPLVIEQYKYLLAASTIIHFLSLDRAKEILSKKFSVFPDKTEFDIYDYSVLSGQNNTFILYPLKPDILGAFFVLDLMSGDKKRPFKNNDAPKLLFKAVLQVDSEATLMFLVSLIGNFPTHPNLVDIFSIVLNDDEFDILFITRFIKIDEHLYGLLLYNIEEGNFSNAQKIISTFDTLINSGNSKGQIFPQLINIYYKALCVFIRFCIENDYIELALVNLNKVLHRNNHIDIHLTNHGDIFIANLDPLYVIPLSISHVMKYYVKKKDRGKILHYYSLLMNDEQFYLDPRFHSLLANVLYESDFTEGKKETLDIIGGIFNNFFSRIKYEVLNVNKNYEYSVVCFWRIKSLLAGNNYIEAEQCYNICKQHLIDFRNTVLSHCANELMIFFQSNTMPNKENYYKNEVNKYKTNIVP